MYNYRLLFAVCKEINLALLKILNYIVVFLHMLFKKKAFSKVFLKFQYTYLRYYTLSYFKPAVLSIV